MTTWVYEVHVVGTLTAPDLARIDAEVGHVRVSAEPATTMIRGSVADQSALVGLLDLIHALGIEVCELRHLAEPDIGIDAEGSADPRSPTRPT